MQFLELLRRDRRRALGHEVLALLGLREGDDVADARRAAEQRHHPVEAERNAAVGRRAEGEGLEHVAEPAFHDIGRDFQHVLEDFLLQRRLVDPDRAAAEFHAVEHDIVMLAADPLRVAVEERRILRHRSGERMVRRHVAVLRLVMAHQGKIHDPEEFPVVRPQRELAALLQ